jgi:hypothetical protein
MQKMISFCGLICSDCAAYRAKQENDEELRVRTAADWSQPGNPLRPEEINCDGCHIIGETLFKYCKICPIRKCAFEKNVRNCAHCKYYLCEKLDNFLQPLPQARESLETIRTQT